MKDKADCSVKKTLIIVGALVVIIVAAAVSYGAGMFFEVVPAWYQNYAPKQPLPFSHKLHAGQYKVPCLYCHGSTEYAAFASVPGLETCMNCHVAVKVESPWMQQMKKMYEANEPVQWTKVHVLPDFVHFNHQRHIKAGVQCAECHGPVETMDTVYQWAPMTMRWCVNCHRNDNHLTENRIRLSREEKRLKGVEKMSQWHEMLSHKDPHNADVSCSTCHY